MPMNTLKDVYIDQVKDLYSACNQSHKMTVQLADAATNETLKGALTAGAEGIKDGMEAAAAIVKAHGEEPSDEFCKGMEGLVKEAKAHAIDEDFGDRDARDAMIITQYQRMVHYGIAGWGCVVAFAKRLGLDEDAHTLQKCLDDTYDGDRRMTEIAAGEVNRAAA
ncbi:ferritin-like domain-containing protein [Pseudaestuariivita sp.]|uniref:ferritin-like domain-containing protein n=1 Tax=Pseudaestuariivita sp. TaxID=2211669 RepID=UPI0040599DCD